MLAADGYPSQMCPQHTETGRREPLRLFQETVEFLHLVQGGFPPASVFADGCFDLFAEWLNVLWLRTQVEHDVSGCHRAGMDSGQREQELPMGKLPGLSLVFVGSVHHPLQKIVGFAIRRVPFSLQSLTLHDQGHDKLLRQA